MTLLKEKQRVIREIEKIEDPKKLNSLYRLISRKQYHNAIVGYKPSGEPITEQDLIKRVSGARARVKKGKFFTQEQVQNEVKKWTQ